MRRAHSAAAKRTLALWRAAPLGARVHCRIRWLTAPFEPLERRLPARGRVLEIGCGHGLFTTYLALSSSDREVRGVDIDDAKIELAADAIARLHAGEANVAIEHRPDGDVPTVVGGWDAIVIVDVLYLLSPDARRDLVRRAADALAPDGVLVVKEVDTSPRFKAKVAQFQEWLSTKVLRITATDHDLYFPSAADVRRLLEDAGLSTTSDRLDRGYFHPHCVIVGTRGNGAAAA